MADKTTRRTMAERLLEKMDENPHFLGFLVTSDEAYFHLEGKRTPRTSILSE